jgi:hypothetical protein
MKTNLSQTDRVLRILLGSMLLSLNLTGVASAWSFYTGLALLLSSAVSFCALYAVLGLGSCQTSNPVTHHPKGPST